MYDRLIFAIHDRVRVEAEKIKQLFIRLSLRSTNIVQMSIPFLHTFTCVDKKYTVQKHVGDTLGHRFNLIL